MDGMTLDEMRATRERLRDGLAELRQQVLRQEGAVLVLNELIEQREQKAAPTDVEAVPLRSTAREGARDEPGDA